MKIQFDKYRVITSIPCS